MPTYEYACPDCGAQFEKVQKFTDKPVKKCPKCGKAKVHRVVSRVAVSFKGSGFYVNDSKSSSSTSSTSSASTKPEKGDKAEKAEKTETAATTPAGSEPASTPASTPAATTSESKSTEKPDTKKSKGV